MHQWYRILRAVSFTLVSLANSWADIQVAFSDSKPALITTPTLHLHGLKDHVFESSKRQLAEHYDQERAIVWEIDYHHAMPWYKADVLKLAGLIRELRRDS